MMNGFIYFVKAGNIFDAAKEGNRRKLKSLFEGIDVQLLSNQMMSDALCWTMVNSDAPTFILLLQLLGRQKSAAVLQVDIANLIELAGSLQTYQQFLTVINYYTDFRISENDLFTALTIAVQRTDTQTMQHLLAEVDYLISTNHKLDLLTLACDLYIAKRGEDRQRAVKMLLVSLEKEASREQLEQALGNKGTCEFLRSTSLLYRYNFELSLSDSEQYPAVNIAPFPFEEVRNFRYER